LKVIQLTVTYQFPKN